MKTLYTNKGIPIFVDDADFEIFKDWRFNLNSKGYVNAYKKGNSVNQQRLARLLLNPKPTEQVDHWNGNKQDNQRHNLRICNQSQNNYNRRKYTNSASQFKGVYRNNAKWKTSIFVDGQEIHLGTFETQHQAGLAYDLWAKDLYGEFARTNNVVVASG